MVDCIRSVNTILVLISGLWLTTISHCTCFDKWIAMKKFMYSIIIMQLKMYFTPHLNVSQVACTCVTRKLDLI